MKKQVLSLMFIITLFSLTAVSASAVVNDTLKVGIRYGSTALEAANLENAVGSGYEFGYYDEERDFICLDETDETTITMQAWGDGVEVTETGSGEVLYRFDEPGYCLGVRPVGRHTETWCKGYKYPGGFEYRVNGDGTLTVINVVDIEDYVKGVVPYEMDKDWPLAALEAQAVCARTYAVKNRHPSLGFDVCAGTCCQVYYGRNRATDLTDEAVDNTAGEMLYYDGKPIENAVYCASNGGATEDGINVWGSDIPYLVGKKDPYEAQTNIPNYSWSVTYTADELTWILEQKEYDIGTVKNVYVAEFTDMGNVARVTFEGSRGSVTVKGETCRTIFYSATYGKSVKSQRFTINGAGAGGGIYVNDEDTCLTSLEGVRVLSGSGKTAKLTGTASVLSASGTATIGEDRKPAASRDGTFTITGTGSGHNLGLSQYGAKAMAELGYTYDEILEFYYTDADIR